MVGLTDGLKKVNKSLFSYDILNLVSEKGKMLAKLRKIKIKTENITLLTGLLITFPEKYQINQK